MPITMMERERASKYSQASKECSYVSALLLRLTCTQLYNIYNMGALAGKRGTKAVN